MYVIATAGHVDHGKSTVLNRLTGMEPDRLVEEQRRGLTVDLGYAWTDVAGRRIAFVDVPGHERFVPNMLAGTGPVGAALFVVAADEGWQRQSQEHLDALDAFGVAHGLLVISKADRADPAAAAAEAGERIAASSLGGVSTVAVSGRTGEGFERLREELAALADRLPQPDTDADVRLWLDRVFTIRGAGTVATGTLQAGTIHAGDELSLAGTDERFTVRGMQELGEDTRTARAVARVALNLRGTRRAELARGDALCTPHAWRTTAEVDVRLTGCEAGELHRRLVLHMGTAAVPVQVRPLGTDVARLSWREPLPLRVADTGLLRDAGEHRVAAGVGVLDVAPPPLRRRGSARARAAELEGIDAGGLAAALVRRRRFVGHSELRAMGLPAVGLPVGGWAVDEQHWSTLAREATHRVHEWLSENSLATGMPVEALRRSLELPDAFLVHTLLEGSELTVRDGLVSTAGGAHLPPGVDSALRRIESELAERPFRAPEAAELTRLGLGTRELAAAERAGRLTRIADGVVLGPDAIASAARELAQLPQPFTASQARQALETSRRVAIPLLEHLDAAGFTRRLPDSTRVHHATDDLAR